MHPRGLNPGGTGTGRQTTRPAGGGLFPALAARPAAVVPGGGVCFPCRFPPAAFSFDSAPIPPPPFPAGRGRFLVFLCKGLRPLHPRGLNPGGTGTGRQTTRPAGGGLFPALAARPAAVVPGGGVCFPCRFPPPPLVLILPPSPRPPSPTGKGEIFGFLMQGASPLAFPGAGWGAALTLLVGNRFFRLQMERWHPLGRREPGL